jgi:hypothetical protein
MLNVSESDVGIKLIKAYIGFSNYPGKLNFELPTPEQQERIIKKGDLEAMVYPFFCANGLNSLGFISEADKLISYFSTEQMVKLIESRGEKVGIHLSSFIGDFTKFIGGQRLNLIEPYVGIKLGSRAYPFLDFDRTGISAIESLEDGKMLYVNPQIFNADLMMPIREFKGSNQSKEYVQIYRSIAISCFGEKNVDSSRPWLKQGILKRD